MGVIRSFNTKREFKGVRVNHAGAFYGLPLVDIRQYKYAAFHKRVQAYPIARSVVIDASFDDVVSANELVKWAPRFPHFLAVARQDLSNVPQSFLRPSLVLCNALTRGPTACKNGGRPGSRMDRLQLGWPSVSRRGRASVRRLKQGGYADARYRSANGSPCKARNTGDPVSKVFGE